MSNVPEDAFSGEIQNEQLRALLDSCRAEIERAKKEPLTFLIVGRTGVGKSSSVNSLMGETVAPIGDWEPKTMTVEKYEHEISGIKFTLIDTPGLCDDLEEKGNDAT